MAVTSDDAAIIYWTLYVRARTAGGRERVLRRFQVAIGLDATMLSAEPYRHDSSRLTWVVRLTSTLEARDASTGVFEMLRIVGRLAYRWSVGAPVESPSGQWTFSGWMDTRHSKRARVAGIDDAGFEMYSSGLANLSDTNGETT